MKVFRFADCNHTDLNQEMYQKPSWWETNTSLVASEMEPLAPKSVSAGQLHECVGEHGVPCPLPNRASTPPSYAIIFALCPISTWEQCKLFKTRISGLAIIIMMISISVAIASDYLTGNFAAWGRRSSWELTSALLGQKGWRVEERDSDRKVVGKMWDSDICRQIPQENISQIDLTGQRWRWWWWCQDGLIHRGRV